MTALEGRPRRWRCWGAFIVANYVYFGTYSNPMFIPPFPVHQGRQEWVDGIRRCSFDYLILDSVDSWRLRNNILLNVYKEPTYTGVGASD